MKKEANSTELTVLTYIERNADATQRELSEHVGISLGMVNLLLKRMVKKGLVKVERLQPNSIKYFLTPKGIANKIERTYGYVVRTYREIILLRSQVIRAVNALSNAKGKLNVLLFGCGDELSGLIEDLVAEHAFDVPAELVMGIENLERKLRMVESDSAAASGKNSDVGIGKLHASDSVIAEKQLLYKELLILTWEEHSRLLLAEKGIKSLNVLSRLEILGEVGEME